MKDKNIIRVKESIKIVEQRLRGIETVAHIDQHRAYGGIIRSAKGKLLEEFCIFLVKIAWDELGGREEDISFPTKKIPIPLRKDYIRRITSTEIRKWIEDNYDEFVFWAQVDVHVFIRDQFVLGIECKSYTENAMLKRILVDFSLLKTKYPELKCALLQLESQLTGDYSQIHNAVIYGSRSTHTLMSYFDIDLNIMTLLDGERRVDEPIHLPEYYKPLEFPIVESVISKIETLLQ